MGVTPLHIAVAKPDSGVIGGFERVLQRVVRRLRTQGHFVRVVTVRTDTAVDDTVGLIPTKALAKAAPDFLAHMAQLAAFRHLDLSDADMVISTQPPSQGIRHDRHLALFYHHDRIFYDLSELYIRSGAVADATLHRELSTMVRAADKLGMDTVTQFLVPSAAVRERLRYFNGIQRVLPFHAGLGHSFGPLAPLAERPRTKVLCVSRHEFPKRTELFVAAAHQVPEVPAVCVGDGNRLWWARQIDRLLDRGASLEADDLWCRGPGGRLPFQNPGGEGRVQFIPHALGRQLDQLYQTARCVVAPALAEDYGLTAIEAMSWGTPLVVCDDGGSLTELVNETGAGLVVPGNQSAIADAVRQISYDGRLAARLGAAGRDAVRYRFTWARAFDQLDEALTRVMSA